MAKDLNEVASRFPQRHFAIIDAVVDQPNVASVTFKEEDGSFLAGAAAAMVSKTRQIAFLGGIDIPLLRKFEVGFTAGAREIDPNIKVAVKYVGSFDDAAAGKELSGVLFDQGADIVFVAAGKAGIGAIDQVKTRGRAKRSSSSWPSGLTAAMWFSLFRTPWGLRVRSCGENPRAAEIAGIDALQTRFWAVVIGGAVAALGGVYLSLAELDLYSDGMTAGRGYIALAAVIFGRWNPWGALGAALFFGFFAALQYSLQRSGIPSELMQALPYLAALVALAGFAGRVRAPAADGIPFERS
jgi:hypothetical protein